MRSFYDDDTLSLKVIEHPTTLMKATKRARKIQKVGEILSILFALFLVIALISGMGWTMYVTLKCNYCCSGPPIYPPYGPFGPK